MFSSRLTQLTRSDPFAILEQLLIFGPLDVVYFLDDEPLASSEL